MGLKYWVVAGGSAAIFIIALCIMLLIILHTLNVEPEWIPIYCSVSVILICTAETKWLNYQWSEKSTEDNQLTAMLLMTPLFVGALLGLIFPLFLWVGIWAAVTFGRIISMRYEWESIFFPRFIKVLTNVEGLIKGETGDFLWKSPVCLSEASNLYLFQGFL